MPRMHMGIIASPRNAPTQICILWMARMPAAARGSHISRYPETLQLTREPDAADAWEAGNEFGSK